MRKGLLDGTKSPPFPLLILLGMSVAVSLNLNYTRKISLLVAGWDLVLIKWRVRSPTAPEGDV